jgi:hypothetical protein
MQLGKLLTSKENKKYKLYITSTTISKSVKTTQIYEHSYQEADTIKHRHFLLSSYQSKKPGAEIHTFAFYLVPKIIGFLYLVDRREF